MFILLRPVDLGDHVLGVFSTREKAEDGKAEYHSKMTERLKKFNIVYDLERLEIHELELDVLDTAYIK
jgi:hypothetical protein